MIDFVSMHTFENEIVDCRKLQIEFQFSRTAQQQLKELAYYCVSEVRKMLCDMFFLDWAWKSRRTKEDTLIKQLKNAQDRCDFSFRGNVITSKINNLKSLDKYNQEQFVRLNSEHLSKRVSVDYWDFFRSLFCNISEPKEIRQNLLTLFQAEEFFFKQRWIGEDLTGHLFTCPYFNKRDLYFGHFDFRIALSCLGSDVDLFAKQAVKFLQQASTIVSDISGRIVLSPTSSPSSCSSYMNYFGGQSQHIPMGREWYMRENEWLQCCFFRGVDWYNLLSPIQTSFLDKKPADSIVYTPLSNGGSSVTVKKSILATRISDLCALKEFLYPVLYPGGIELPITALLNQQNTSYIAKPRSQWECVPVLDNEVLVEKDKIVIKHQSYCKPKDGSVS